MIQFACPACQKQYTVGDEHAGKQVTCKACGQAMLIPAAAAVVPVAADGPDFGAIAQQASHEASAAQAAAAANAKARSSETLTGTTENLGYEISQRPDFSMVTVNLPPGGKILAEPSVMMSMSPNINMVAGFRGGLGRTLGKMLGGESMITNTFTAEGSGGEVLFASGAAGDVMYQRLNNQTMYLQRGAYMLCTDGIDLTGKWQGAKGFFSGEGLVLLKASGTGDLFFNSYGAIMEIDVQDQFIVDTGYIVAFEESLQYNISVLPGLRAGGKIKSFFFGGEGLVARFSGSGKVWVQTRQVTSFLSWVHPFRPVKDRG
jgi:uncharacterized protein (TIGR00266 family)